MRFALFSNYMVNISKCVRKFLKSDYFYVLKKNLLKIEFFLSIFILFQCTEIKIKLKNIILIYLKKQSLLSYQVQK
jgi:hypothetical protein